MKKVLILVQSRVSRDIRVKRQIEWLMPKYDIFLSAIDAPLNFPKNRFYYLPHFKDVFGGRLSILFQALVANSGFFKKFNFIHFFHKKTLSTLIKLEFDIIIANDANTLPLGYFLKDRKPHVKLIYDDHEYAPTEHEGDKMWEFLYQPVNLRMLELIYKVNQVVTVGYNIAERFKREYHVEPLVITNAPAQYQIKEITKTTSKIKLIHHGIISKQRQPELMIEMAKYLDERFDISFMFIGKSIEIERLQNLAKPFLHKIHFIDPVDSDEIVEFISSFDIGVFILPPLNFTFLNALPNKLFEFIQAGLAVAIGPSKEMAQIVNEYSLGVVASEFTPQSLAIEINKISYDMLYNFKLNSRKAANLLNAENNGLAFVTMVEKLFK